MDEPAKPASQPLRIGQSSGKVTIAVSSAVRLRANMSASESSSKPDRGVVTVESKGFNQDGQEVCYFRRRVMVWKRAFAPERTRPYDVDSAWS